MALRTWWAATRQAGAFPRCTATRRARLACRPARDATRASAPPRGSPAARATIATGPGWQTNCTFCHGTAGRTGFLAGTDLRLAAAPPVGTQGEDRLDRRGRWSTPGPREPFSHRRLVESLACTVCHPSPLPADVTHVNGLPTAITFSGLATTGSAAPVYNRTASPTCSSTYCHGNFTGGATTAAPAWTGAAMTCTSCHGNPPSTGEHAPRSSKHNFGCNVCHGAGYTSTTIVLATHVNGVKNVAAGNPPGWNPANRTCSNSCHGTESW